MNALIADALFANTTVDPMDVNQYLFNTDFNLLNYGKKHNASHLELQLLARMERVAMRIRQYLAGATNRVYPTLRQVTLFIHAHPELAFETVYPCIAATVANIRYDLDNNQWYELMPRLDRIAEMIVEFFAVD